MLASFAATSARFCAINSAGDSCSTLARCLREYRQHVPLQNHWWVHSMGRKGYRENVKDMSGVESPSDGICTHVAAKQERVQVSES